MFESLLKSLSGELLFDELHNSTYAAGTSLAGQCVGDGIIAAISMQVGEDTLFTKIRNTKKSIEITASGRSCSHQIKDGTNRKIKPPITLLKEAII